MGTEKSFQQKISSKHLGGAEPLPEETPLTDSQKGVYLECVAAGPTVMYNVAFEWKFPKANVDPERLAKAAEKAVASYVAFEIQFKERRGIPYMVHGPQYLPTVERLTLSEDAYLDYRNAYVRPFTFGEGPLGRMTVAESESSVYFLFDVHHLVFDGLSITVFGRAIAQAYAGEAITPEQLTIFDVSAKEQELLATEGGKSHLEETYGYWSTYLDGAEKGMGLAPDKGVENPGCLRSTVEMKLSSSVDEVRGFTHALSLTENTLLMGAFVYTLGLLTGQKDVLFTTVNHGRGDKALKSTVGMFVRTLPMRVSYQETDLVSKYLAALQANLYTGIAHEEASFSEMAKRFGISSNVSFVYQGTLLEPPAIGGTPASMRKLDLSESMDDLQLMAFKDGDTYSVSAHYRSDLYTDELITEVVRLYSHVVSQMLTAERLGDIDPLCAESRQLIDRFNATETPAHDWLSPAQRICAWAKQRPDSIAVTCRDNSVTYGNLVDSSLRLSGKLVQLGIVREDFVPVMVERDEQMAICALGVALSGAAYEPLDPTYPAERIDFMMEDAAAKVLVCDRKLSRLIEHFDGEVVYTDEIAKMPLPVEDALPVTADDAIVMLYTSGTTGKPKGTILTNRNIDALIRGHARTMQLSPDSVYATYASFGFDAAVMDIWSTLGSGARLLVVPDEIRLDLPAIDELFTREGVTHAFMTTQVARMFALKTKAPKLTHLMLGGEKIIPFQPPQGLTVLNGYGPSEATAYVTCHQVTDSSSFQPIGKAVDDVKLYVVDEEGRLLPPGAHGELWVAGPHVCREYLNRPEKNAEAFSVNSFCSDPAYGRVYRTGDVVRLLPTGEYEFVGRADSQVKIRGFRIELTEVERVILDFPGVKDVTVRALDAAAGGKRLVAYVASDIPLDLDALRRSILQRKPPYMVPSTIVALDAIPRNSRNKVDWRNLPEPQEEASEVVAPQTQRQREILSLAESVLGVAGIGITTDLFDAGLSSISSMALAAELDGRFHVPVRMKDLRTHFTVKALDELVGKALGENESSSGARTEARLETPPAPEPEPSLAPHEELPAAEYYPLTMTQEGIYVECSANPTSTFYNIPVLLELDADVSLSRLRHSVAQAISAHPMLLTRLKVDSNGSIGMRKCSNASFHAEDVKLLQVSCLDEVKDQLVKAFNLTGGSLVRARIIQADKNYLFIDVHHIIADGTSLAILLEDISNVYAGRELEPERLTGYDISLEEKRLRESPEFQKAKRHYTELLSDAETDFLPARDKNPSGEGMASVTAESAPSTVTAAKSFCKSNHLTLNSMFNAAFGLVLARFNASESSAFCTVYNGRNDPRLARTVSMLVKTLPVVLSGFEASPAALAHDVGAQLMASMDNDLFSFAEISRTFNMRPDVMFIYQGSIYSITELCGMPARSIALELSSEKVPLSIEVMLQGDRFAYKADFDASRYTEDFVRGLLLALDQAICEFPLRDTTAQVSIVSPWARERLDAINATESDRDMSATALGMFLSQLERDSLAPAVIYRDVRLTYGELYDRAQRLAARLIELGLQPGEFVPMLIERSDWMPVCALGVALAGGAYEPLDPTYPAERLSFMVEDASGRILIADKPLMDLLPAYKGRVVFTDEIATCALPSKDVQLAQPAPDDPLVVLYTSGTTGTPKGLVLTEGNLATLAFNHCNTVGMGPGDVSATYASSGFDCCQMDIFCTLALGACLLVVPTEMRLDMSAMDELLIREGATHIFMTTQIARMFSQMTKCPTLRFAGGGGEKLVPLKPPKGLSYVNMYGPSECSVYVSQHRITDNGPFQPLGYLNQDVKAYILDASGNLLPPGAAGELCIAGPQVTPGYLNRPEKNAEAFLPNPWSNNAAYGQLYRTGDIVRILPTGQLDFVGRRDGLVKVRGFRIELAEVEGVILDFPGVDGATVQPFDDAGGGKFLAAYVTGAEPIDLDALRTHIANKKPPYMVPASFAQLDAIPRTVNGKVDRKALPAPEFKGHESGATPANEAESLICGVFREVLGLEQVFADDDFFAIGGTSIIAVQATILCSERGLDVTYSDLFANPTPQALARACAVDTTPEPLLEAETDRTEGYDLAALAGNKVCNLSSLERRDVGDTLLLGGTGFLGSHILRELLTATDNHLYCLVRRSRNIEPEKRLTATLVYYFDDWYTPEVAKRVTVIEGALGEDDLSEKLATFEFNTIIDCAANVKHFAAGDEIIRDNFHSTSELIDLAQEHDACLVYASTISVSGTSVNGSVPSNVRLRECDLDIGQTLDNQYTYSKFLSERAILDAISRGRIRGKIMRLGNLMPRLEDGIFQINARSNSCMNTFRACERLGCFPIDCMDAPIEFSAIEHAARAVVLLAGTNDEFTVFHVKNFRMCHMGDVVRILISRGHPIDLVTDSEFNRRFSAALEKGEEDSSYTSLVAYLRGGNKTLSEALCYTETSEYNPGDYPPGYQHIATVSTNDVFSTKTLYRLGFAWPLISEGYLHAFIEALEDIRFL